MARVFISHSSRDNAVAAEIMEWLASRGFDHLFLDIDKHAGIPPGSNWERELYRKVDSVQAMILVITPNWHDSKWCFVEFAQARALGKAIYPVILAPGGERFIAPDIQQLDLQQDREGGLERLAGELTRLALDAQGGFVWDPGRSPYPGLLAFEKEDAAVFFGRDDDIRALIERLNARRVRGDIRFVCLLGSSGSGKSSVVRAGALPRLERDKRNWIVLPPFRPRRNPTAEFARAVCEALGRPQDWRSWRDGLEAGDGARLLEDVVDEARLRDGAREAHLLVTIDQGEELFTVATADEVERLFALLDRATSDDLPVVVLMSLRSDYLGKLQDTAKMLRFDQVSLRPFPRARVRQIIEGPARIAGIGVDEEFVATALTDMGTDDALPLLAFTLRELHDRFSGRGATGSGEPRLSLAHYRMLGDDRSGVNPLENAVRKRADEVLEGMRLSEADLAALREAFVGTMVRIDEEGQYARRPAAWDDLPGPARPILENLAAARLVVIRYEAGVRIAEVAHEALLRKWDRLRAWLDAERDFLVGKAQLRFAMADWESAAEARKATALLQGLPLVRARQWLADHGQALTGAEKRYMEASIERDDAERRAKGRWRLVGSIGAAITVLALVGAGFLARERHAASIRAEAAALAVQARSSLAIDPIGAVASAAWAADTQLTVDTRSVLLESILGISPHLIEVRRLAGIHPAAVALAASPPAVWAGGPGGLATWRPRATLGQNGHAEGTAAVRPVSVAKSAPIFALGWSDRSLLTVSTDGRLAKVDGSTQKSSSVKLLHVRQPTRVSIGAAGKVLLAEQDGDVRYFDCANALNLGRADCEGRSVASGRTSALALDDERAAAAIGFEDGKLRIVGFGRDRYEATYQVDGSARIVTLAWSRDGRHLAVGTVDGRTLITDARAHLVAEAPRQSESVSALAWDASSKRLGSVCDTFSICVWQFSQAKDAAAPLRFVARLSGHADVVRSLAFDSGGDRLVSAADDDTVRIWSLGDVDRAVAERDAGDDVALTDLDVSADNKWIAAGDVRGSVHIWSLPPRSGSASLHVLDAAIEVLAWSPRGSAIAAGDRDGHVAIRNWPDDGTAIELATEPSMSALRWKPDGSGIFTAGSVDGSIAAVPLRGGATVKFERGPDDAVLGLGVDPGGNRLLSTDALGKVGQWSIATRKMIGALRASGASRDTAAYGHDGRRFLVAGNSGEVLVYDSADEKEPIRCRSGSRQLDGAGFGPDDTLVAAVSQDAVLHLWSLNDRCEILASAPLPAADRKGRGVALRPHLVAIPALQALAVTTSDRRVLLISLDVNTWLARAHSMVPAADE